MRKQHSIRCVLSLCLALIVSIGCCMPAFAAVAPTADAQTFDEAHITAGASFEQSTTRDDLLIKTVIVPKMPEYYLLVLLLELPLLPFQWVGEKLTDAWNFIEDAFWEVVSFFGNLID